MNLDEGTIEIKRSYSVASEDGPVFKKPKTRAGRRIVEVGPTLVKILREHKRSQAQAKLASEKAWNEYNLVCTTDEGNFIKPRALRHLFRRRTRMLPIRFFGTLTKEDLDLNEYVVTNQWIFPKEEGGKRLDVVIN